MGIVISFSEAKLNLKRTASKPPGAGPVYFSDQIYNRVVFDIAALFHNPCPFADVASLVKITLGEGMDIWPASIVPN